MLVQCDTSYICELNEMLKYFNTSISEDDMIDNPYIKYFGYKSNNELVGFVSFSVLYERAELNYIFVKQEFRQGLVGTILLEEMIKFCDNEKVSSITLEVRESNKAAINLYIKLGFNSIAKRDRYYQNENGLLMEKVL